MSYTCRLSNLDHETYAKLWYCLVQRYGVGNSRISDDEYETLEQKWGSNFAEWQDEYEDIKDLSDEELEQFFEAEEKGRQNVKDTKVSNAGMFGNKEKTVEEIESESSTRRGVSGSVGGTSVIGTSVSLGIGIAADVAAAALTKAAKKAAEEAAEKAAKKAAEAFTARMTADLTKKTAEEGMKKGLVVASGESAELAAKTAEEAAATAAEEAAAKEAEVATAAAAKETAQKVSAIIGCAMALATGIAYEASAPNRQESKALGVLDGTLKTEQGNLATAQQSMQDAGSASMDEATKVQTEKDEKQAELEKAQSDLETKQEKQAELQEEYNTNKETIDDVKGNSNRTKSDISRAKKAQTAITSIAPELENAETEVSTSQGELNAAGKALEEAKKTVLENTEERQETLDEHLEQAAEVKGEVDETVQLAQTTKASAIVEAIMQGVNVISGGISTARAFILPFVGWWVGAMGAAGVAMSLHGVIEQGVIAGKAGDTLGTSDTTDKSVSTTVDVYNQNSAIHDIVNDDVTNYNIDGLDEYTSATFDNSWYDASVAEEEIQITPQVSGGGDINNVITGQKSEESKKTANTTTSTSSSQTTGQDVEKKKTDLA